MAGTTYSDLRDDLDAAISAVETVINHKHPRIHIQPLLIRLKRERRRVDQTMKGPEPAVGFTPGRDTT